MATLLIVYAIMTPEKIFLNFSQKGFSPIEITTVGLFFFQILIFWMLPPVPLKTKKGKLLSLNFSVITLIAIAREMDWHRALIDVSNIQGATNGTPFKMRFLTNPINPLADRQFVLFCFIFVIALCAGTLLWYIRPLLKGLRTFHPVCWSIAFLGGSFILINIFDRMGSVLHKEFNFEFTEQGKALICLMEEGQELLLPLFVIIAVIQSHFIYNADENELQSFRNQA